MQRELRDGESENGGEEKGMKIEEFKCVMYIYQFHTRNVNIMYYIYIHEKKSDSHKAKRRFGS